MCRWLAYSGTPVLLEELLFRPKHSLIDQSLHSTMGAETTNGDGLMEKLKLRAVMLKTFAAAGLIVSGCGMTGP